MQLKNGLKWTQTGKVSIKLKKKERAVARPTVIKKTKCFICGIVKKIR